MFVFYFCAALRNDTFLYHLTLRFSVSDYQVGQKCHTVTKMSHHEKISLCAQIFRTEIKMSHFSSTVKHYFTE